MPDITHSRADVSKIAAIHHPLRRRLLEILGADGPATASLLAARTAQLVGNVSHHLKVLASAGLIEEAPDLARDRRERWWRRIPMSLSWSVADMPVGSAQVVAEAAEQQNLAHHVAKMHDWYEQRGSYHRDWSQAAYSTEFWLRLTPDELVELSERLSDVVVGFDKSVDKNDGQDRESVFLFAHAVPSKP
ncbi:MAG: winged helix-turn-helix domain-containing protein [Nocardioidaceae bacterium]